MENKMLQNLAKCADKYMSLERDCPITWCGGCGNYGIQHALKRALALEGMGRRDFAIFFDVGCCGNGADKLDAYTFHGLHGRTLPVAAGAAIVNPRIKVIGEAGDGATFSEGVNHLVHAVRNDYPMMFIMHNNENYGLTTGQASALTRLGVKMNSSPDGVVIPPLHAVEMVLSLSPSFVARAYSGWVDHMTEVFREGLRHKGFSFIEVFQACPTYNRTTPEEWYEERVKDVSQLKNYKEEDLDTARKLARDIDKDIYVGVLYRDRSRSDFIEVQPNRAGIKTSAVEEVKHYDIKDLY
ncbi:2-oxoacid:ferredoxin oxidoreductase subunit beta [Candidatus Peregrinibacteria bacterium]|nr:2-oxoacid:ferredoxin oxidoreductase subunit beta [Candidatus Peregrinibacteria bacterium]